MDASFAFKFSFYSFLISTVTSSLDKLSIITIPQFEDYDPSIWIPKSAVIEEDINCHESPIPPTSALYSFPIFISFPFIPLIIVPSRTIKALSTLIGAKSGI